MAGGVPCKCVDGKPGARGMNWRGAYSGGASYGYRDAVSYAGSSYFYKLTDEATGIVPTNAAYWDVLAAKGEDGGGGGGDPTTLPLGSIVITVNSDYNGTTQTAAVQVKDGAGDNLTKKVLVGLWLSTDPLGIAGATFQSVDVDIGNKVTGQADSIEWVLTDASGAIHLTVTNLSAPNAYLNVTVGDLAQASSTTLQGASGGGGD